VTRNDDDDDDNNNNNNNNNPRRYSSGEPWPAEQPPLAVFTESLSATCQVPRQYDASQFLI
jgi:hypothetical protein